MDVEYHGKNKKEMENRKRDRTRCICAQRARKGTGFETNHVRNQRRARGQQATVRFHEARHCAFGTAYSASRLSDSDRMSCPPVRVVSELPDRSPFRIMSN